MAWTERRRIPSTLGNRRFGHRAHHHDRNVPENGVCCHGAQHRGTIHHRHHVVKKDQVGQHLQAVLAVDGGQHAEAFIGQNRIEQLGNAELVIHHQHRLHEPRSRCGP